MNTEDKINIIKSAICALRGANLSWKRKLLIASEVATACGLHVWRTDLGLEITRNSRSFKVLAALDF